VKIEVRDAGPGIPHEQHERMFDRFYRGVGPGSEGFGLGLSNVRSVAQAHSAVVEAVPRPDGGLSITVTFPRA
jgi:signal transduction histidine kinase